MVAGAAATHCRLRFYVWNLHSSGSSPIFMPALWPH